MRDDESKDTLASQLPTIIFIHLSLLKLRHLEELEICTIHLVSMADTSLFFTDPLSPPHAFQQFLHVAHRGTHTHKNMCRQGSHIVKSSAVPSAWRIHHLQHLPCLPLLLLHGLSLLCVRVTARDPLFCRACICTQLGFEAFAYVPTLLRLTNQCCYVALNPRCGEISWEAVPATSTALANAIPTPRPAISGFKRFAN